jgi:hypothetical protein
MEEALLANPGGFTIARLCRILPDDFEAVEGEILTQEQWEELMDSLGRHSAIKEALGTILMELDGMEDYLFGAWKSGNLALVDKLRGLLEVARRPLLIEPERRLSDVFSMFILRDDSTWTQPAFRISLPVNHSNLSNKELEAIAINHFGGFIGYGLQTDSDNEDSQSVEIITIE